MTHRQGLNTKPGEVNSGLNSGFQAINLAYHFGARRIVLLGYDMQHTGGKTHWHGDHPRGLTNAEGISSWVKYFRPLAEDLARLGVEVVNCSTDTALTCFTRAPLEATL